MALNDIGEIGLLVQEAFSSDQGLRHLLEMVVNSGMREEASAHVGAGMHERAADRRGYRNGTKQRRFKTRVGELELEVPQVRDCEPYHPSMFSRWERSERAMLRDGLEDCLMVQTMPLHHQKRLTSTNLLENMMKRLKKRTRVVGVFPNRSSCDRLIGAQLLELHETWMTEEKAYFNMEYAGA